MSTKPFNCYNHGTGRIDLTATAPTFPSYMYRVAKPIELHLKEDGTVNNTPSVCIVLEMSNGTRILGEISVQMLNEGLKDIGYELVKK